LSPFAPHTAEEIWEKLGYNKAGGSKFVSTAKWPKANEKLIDRKMEMAEELVEQTLADAREIMKLVGKNPKDIEEINIYVAPQWKHTVRQEIIRKAKAKSKKGLMATLMKNPAIRKEGRDAVRFIESITKLDTAKLREILNAQEELSALQGSRELLESQLGCRVNVIPVIKSKSPRAARAEPGKPGIELV